MPEGDTEGEDYGGDHVASLRSNLVATAGGEADLLYPLAAIAVPVPEGSPLLIAAVLVGISASDEVIFAVPNSVWHRTAARRVLPRNFARKLCAGRVRLVGPDARETPLEGDCRVWFGILTEDGEAATDFVRDLEDPVELAHTFGPEEASDALPFGPSVLDASRGLFEFVTAESAASVGHPAAGAQSGDPVGDRIATLKACFQEMRQDLAKVLGAVGAAKESSPRLKTSAAPVTSSRRPAMPRAAETEFKKFHGLDPAVTQAALDAGIEPNHLEEMSKLLRKQGGRLGDMPGAGARRTPKARAADDLGDEDSFPETVPDKDLEPATALNPIEVSASSRK